MATKRPFKPVMVIIAIGAVLALGLFVLMSAGTTTIDFSEGALADGVAVQPARWPRVETAHARVFRESSVSEAAAWEVLDELERVHERLVEHFPSLPLGRIEVVLLPEAEYGGKALSVPRRMTWPLVLDEEGEGLVRDDARQFLYYVIPHEWAEAPIGFRFYWRDRHMRWFGDGVAEYAGFVVSRALEPQVACARLEEYLARLAVQDPEPYDLLADFPVWGRRYLHATPEEFEVMNRGYAFSFAVFYDLASQYGGEVVDELLGQSLGWLWPPGRRVQAEVEALLGESGPTLTAMPYAWAVERIEVAAGEVCPRALVHGS